MYFVGAFGEEDRVCGIGGLHLKSANGQYVMRIALLEELHDGADGYPSVVNLGVPEGEHEVIAQGEVVAVQRNEFVAAAKVVGKVIAERAIAAGVLQVVFDRGGYKYHGRVKSLADAAREAGLKF